jgi:hypothetical protein
MKIKSCYTMVPVRLEFEATKSEILSDYANAICGIQKKNSSCIFFLAVKIFLVHLIFIVAIHKKVALKKLLGRAFFPRFIAILTDLKKRAYIGT